MDQPRPAGPPADQEALVLRDAAELLYSHGVGGQVVSTAASTLVAFLLSGDVARERAVCWWLAMSAVQVIRALQLLLYWRRAVWGSPQRDGAREIRLFSAGVLVSGWIWSIFPILFFDDLTPASRAAMAAAMAGLAGGGTTLFAPAKGLSWRFAAFLLLPASLRFLLEPGPENTLLGLLGLGYLATMLVSARIAHNSVVESLRLSRVNQQLLAEKEAENRRANQTNTELQALQMALEEANQSLEYKVRDRTGMLLNEIKERERYEQELSLLASTDPLTGLCNRASITQRLAAVRDPRFALLFIDLDGFKQVNDVRGHHMGDRVLSVVAGRLREALGQDAQDIARWGGDEFVVILRGSSSSAGRAFDTAAALRDSIARPIDSFGNGESALWIDATIGISLYPDHGLTYDQLVRAADLAMYAAKPQKHQRVRLFDPSLAEQAAKGHFLGQCLSEAIATRQLSLAFQPIVSASSGRCVALEALARWEHPARGPIPPSEFIPLAERSGDILALGRWVLMEACRAASGWAGADPPAVSVNVSATQLLAGSLADDVRHSLEETGLPPHRLHLELTETAFAGDYEGIAPVLAKLRAVHGVRISLDDFGTGFSSLAYLQRLPVDTIKIDKTFIGDIERAESASIVGGIVSIARALGYDLIAEGVERETQMASLRALGIETQQGYLFSPPIPGESVEPWLDSARQEAAAP